MTKTNSGIHQGGCSCGKAQYQVSGTPLFVHCCHCSYCQQQSGSAFAINALIESSNVKLMSGDTEVIQTPTPSGRGQKITRCENCKIALWSNYGGAGDAMSFVRVGTLVNPNVFPPNIHIYTSTKQDWVQLPKEIPVVGEYYNSRDFWPRKSLERVKALRSA